MMTIQAERARTVVKCLLGAVVCIAVSPRAGHSEVLKLEPLGNAKINKLQVKAGSGDLQIEASSDGLSSVVADRRAGGDDCTVDVKVDDGTLKIETNSKDAKRCRIDVKLKLPSVVDMAVDMGSGDAAIAGVGGTLRFRSGSGDLAVAAALTSLDVQSGSGDIAVSGVTGSIDIKTGSGDIAIASKSLPEKGQVNVRTGSGDVAVSISKAPVQGEIEIKTGSGDVSTKLPSDSKVRVEMMTGSGSVRDTLGRSEDAKLVLKVRTGSGDLSVGPI